MPPPSQPAHPTLTPQLCLSTDSLRAFLRLSRAAIDDPINQHLNSLSHASELPFDPSTISAARSVSPSRRGLPPSSCAGFVSHTLFPAYAARARVLEYCAAVAEEKDVVGSDAGRGGGGKRTQWGGTTVAGGGALAIGAGVVGPEADDTQGQRPSPGPDGLALSSARRPRVVDERLDPYSARDYGDELPGERLARVIREEKTIETIVRRRTWEIVKDRCGAAIEGWEEGMKRWEIEMEKAQTREVDKGSSDKKSTWSGLWN